jgi:hypothetical protein
MYALHIHVTDAVDLTPPAALLVIRTWAFWKKSKKLLIGLSVYSVVRILQNTDNSIDFYHCIVDNHRRDCRGPQSYIVDSRR